MLSISQSMAGKTSKITESNLDNTLNFNSFSLKTPRLFMVFVIRDERVKWIFLDVAKEAG